MKQRIYVDTSAFVKEFSSETGSDVVSQIFELADENDIVLITSFWTLGEAITAYDKKFRRGEITQKELIDTIQVTLYEVMDLSGRNRLHLVEVDNRILQKSWKWITKYHISSADSLQIFSDVLSLCNIFLAADKRLVEVAKMLGLTAFNVEDSKDVKKLNELIGEAENQY